MTLLYEDGAYELWSSSQNCVPEVYKIGGPDYHPLGSNEDGIVTDELIHSLIKELKDIPAVDRKVWLAAAIATLRRG